MFIPQRLFPLLLIYLFSFFSSFELNANNESLPLNKFKYLIINNKTDKWARLAQEELLYYFKAITDNELIVATSASTESGNIFLGTPSRDFNFEENGFSKKVDKNGFMVISHGNNVAIKASQSVNTVYGVYAFFEELGLRIFACDSEVLPKADVAVKPFKIIKNPVFNLFALYPAFYYYSKVMGLKELARLGYSPISTLPEARNISLQTGPGLLDPEFIKYYGEKKAEDLLFHAVSFLCPPYRYLQNHPEYYARDEKNKPYVHSKTPADMVQLCLSNPDVFRIALQQLLYWMEKTPDAKYYYVLQGDNWNWCRCENCRKLDPPGLNCFSPTEKWPWPSSHMTDRYLWFINKLAREIREKFPDKIIVASVYQANSQFPQTVKKLESNVYLLLCFFFTEGCRCQSHDLYCDKNKIALDFFPKWKNFAQDRIFIFEYPMNYINIYTPFFSHDAMRKRLEFYRTNEVEGVFYCGQPYLFGKMFLYVQGRLRWSLNRNAEELENDFLAAYYGNAAEAMKDFLKLIRNRIYDKQHAPHQASVGNNSVLAIPDFIEKAYVIFDRAENAVSEDPQYLERVKYEKLCGVLWADLDKCITKDEIKKLELLKEVAEICSRTEDKRMVARLTANADASMYDWLEKRFSLDIKCKEWTKSSIIQELIKCKSEADFISFRDKYPLTKSLPHQVGDKIIFSPGTFKIFSNKQAPILKDGIHGYVLDGGDIFSGKFMLSKMPEKALTLEVTAIDDDKPQKTHILIKLNNKIIFDGDNPFSEKHWTKQNFKIPVEFLRKGINQLQIENISPAEVYGKWILVSNVCIFPVPSEWNILKKFCYNKTDLETKTINLWSDHKKGFKATFKPEVQIISPIGKAAEISIADHPESLSLSSIQLRYSYLNNQEILKKGNKIKISFWAKSLQPGEINVNILQYDKKINTGGTSAIFQISKSWEYVSIEYKIPKKPESILLPDIFLGKLNKGNSIYVSPVFVEYQ